MTEPSDQELVASIRRGDDHAFGLLVRRHIDALHHYAQRLSSSPTLADDLVQEAWLAAWQHAASYSPRKAKVSTWLHKILHNKYIDIVRKNRLRFDEAAVAAALDPYDADKWAATEQANALLNQLIDQLPANQKAAIVLTHVQGFSNREVAHILGLRIRAAESLLARARAALKSAYAQHLAKPGQAQSSSNATSNRI